jgi:probable addiction module antidote protein
MDDGSHEVFMLALRDLADAKGISDLAIKSGLNRENMYRILSEKGNPQLGSLTRAKVIKPYYSATFRILYRRKNPPTR